MNMFKSSAQDMIALAMGAMDKTIGKVQAMVDGTMNRMAQAAEANQKVRGREQEVVTNNNQTTYEQHDHWHLTVNSQAQKEDLTHDYATMKALVGVRR
jgi:hypothetical protein